MAYQSDQYSGRDPVELRTDFVERWTAKDRAWEARIACKCSRPVPGPKCFGACDCRKCGRRMVKDAK